MTNGDGRPPATSDPLSSDSAARAVASSTTQRRQPLVAAITVATVACLLAITIVPPGATRVFSSPWSILYAATLLGPVCVLLLRAFDAARPLVLPSTGWQLTAAAAALTLLASALLSPQRNVSLLWAAPLLSAIAVFIVACDALYPTNASVAVPRQSFWRWVNALFFIIGLSSLLEWLFGLRHMTWVQLVAGRNAYPLGHANYTAGLAILMLPGFLMAALPSRGASRWFGLGGTALALALLFSSGSRGGMIALVVVIALVLLFSGLSRATKWRTAIVAVVAALAFVAANPRTRAMFGPADPDLPPNISNVQRQAMLLAGGRMGLDRPVLGWGPGTTPLVFPRYRAGVAGGAEDVLQLHSVPVQLWAELGGAGLLCAAAALGLAFRGRRLDVGACIALFGYAVFALFDAQLDVPIFGFALAVIAALLAPPAVRSPRAASWMTGALAALGLGLVVAGGRPDPTPELNAEALRIGARPESRAKAVALLRESLARNADQEIAHFNLGWLLVVDDPPAAAQHFRAAAQLVPDKGGVYFGLGLARLNAGDPAGAARAFALESLNDPAFLLSPWWQTPQLAAVRADTLKSLGQMQDQIMTVLPATTWAGREVRYLRVFAVWVAGEATAEAVAAVANTPARRTFFRRNPTPAELNHIGSETLQRERLGYPVLMRNLDLAPPIDLWTIQQSKIRESGFAPLVPDKGWLPSPLLIALLEGRDMRNN